MSFRLTVTSSILNKQARKTKLLISFKTSMKTRITESLFSKFPTKGYVTTVWLSNSDNTDGLYDLLNLLQEFGIYSEICLDLSLDARCRAGELRLFAYVTTIKIQKTTLTSTLSF